MNGHIERDDGIIIQFALTAVGNVKIEKVDTVMGTRESCEFLSVDEFLWIAREAIAEDKAGQATHLLFEDMLKLQAWNEAQS